MIRNSMYSASAVRIILESKAQVDAAIEMAVQDVAVVVVVADMEPRVVGNEMDVVLPSMVAPRLPVHQCQG